MEYRVVKITNNIKDYPECAEDTEMFSHLVKHIEDEMDIFIVAENGDFWQADEFFHMTSIVQFRTKNNE